MPVLKSNIFKILFKPTFFKYTILSTINLVDQNYAQQLTQFFQSIDINCLVDINYLYLPYQWSYKTQYFLMLLSGEQVKLTIKFSQIENKEEQKNYVLSLIAKRLMNNTKFIYCQYLNSCFNAFQQTAKKNNTKQIPGFSLEILRESENNSIFIKPNYLVIDINSNISQDYEVFIDLMSGKFVNKTDVVRVQKKQQDVLIHFRNKSIYNKKHLKMVSLRGSVGFDLANSLKKYLQRIELTSGQFLKKWNISIDNRSSDFQVTFIDPGFIGMGNNSERALNNMIFPVSRSSYNNYYKMNFDVPFDSFPQVDILLCFSEKSQKIQKFKEAIQQIKQRMNLKLTITNINLYSSSVERWKQFLINQLTNTGKNLYLIQQPQNITKQFENLIKQSLIKQKVLFQFFREEQISSSDINQNQVTALQHLGVICTKLRMAPWRLKNIPFCEYPFSVASINVQKKRNGQYSVSIVFSLNSYLSKFKNDICQCDQSKIEEVQSDLLLKCIQKFQSIHKIFPIRIFIFRSGKSINTSEKQYNNVKDKIQKYYQLVKNTKLNHVVFIKVNEDNNSNLRLFFQADYNNLVLNPQTVKPAGLLTCLEFNKKIYIQLKYFQPITQFQMIHEDNDPNFSKKVITLIGRLAFGSVGGKFGGGLGFINFSKVLNRYRQFDLINWKNFLNDGNMIYL